MAEQPDELELPRGVALAWGSVAAPTRGPKRELSLDAIVRAAIELADAEGIEGLSMGKVAQSLGFTTMSLYRYVSAKDDLVLLMQDAGLGAPPRTAQPDWRTGLGVLLDAYIERMLAHPWLLRIIQPGPPLAPNALAWLDWGLEILRTTPLSYGDRLAAMMLVSGLARWESEVRAPAAGSAADGARWFEVVAALAEQADLPALREAFEGGLGADPEADEIAAGRDWALRGLAASMAERAESAMGAAPGDDSAEAGTDVDALARRSAPRVQTDRAALPPPPDAIGDEAAERAWLERAEAHVAEVRAGVKAEVAAEQAVCDGARRRVREAERQVEQVRSLGEQQIALAKQRVQEAKARLKVAAKRQRDS